jgi:hypothetical protein
VFWFRVGVVLGCLVPSVNVLFIRTLERSMTQQIVRYGPISSSSLCDDGLGLGDGSVSFNYEEPMLDETIFEG